MLPNLQFLLQPQIGGPFGFGIKPEAMNKSPPTSASCSAAGGGNRPPAMLDHVSSPSLSQAGGLCQPSRRSSCFVGSIQQHNHHNHNQQQQQYHQLSQQNCGSQKSAGVMGADGQKKPTRPTFTGQQVEHYDIYFFQFKFKQYISDICSLSVLSA